MKPKPIDEEVERVIGILSGMNPYTVRYTKTVENLKILCEAKNKSSSMDFNTIMPIVGNIIITVLVLNHERLHIITTKAGTFWRR